MKKMELNEIAMEYNRACKELKIVKKEIAELFNQYTIFEEFTGEYQNKLYNTIKILNEERNKDYLNRQGSNFLDYINGNEGIKFKVLEKARDLLVKRKNIKRRKGYLTRLLYLKGNSLIKNQEVNYE